MALTAIMGDLVASERHGSKAALHRQFNAAVKSANAAHRPVIAAPLTITLGDEFQGLATSLAAALPIVRTLRFALMADGVDCRFALGVADVEVPAGARDAWNMMGAGLADTRAKLEEKRAVSLYRFSIAGRAGDERTLDALGAGLTTIERNWTGRQREDIAALLADASPAELARRRKVSVHNIYKVRAAGDYEAYVTMWQALTENLAAIDHEFGMAR